MSTEQIPGLPGLHREIMSLKNPQGLSHRVTTKDSAASMWNPLSSQCCMPSLPQPSPAAFHRPFPLRKRNLIIWLSYDSQNLNSFNPLADASKGDDLLSAGTEDYIRIRIQQRFSVYCMYCPGYKDSMRVIRKTACLILYNL